MLYGLRGWIGKLLPRGPFFCNLCGYSGSIWLWRGHDNEAIKKHQIVGAGRRQCDCFACGSSDRDRLMFEFLKQEISDFNSIHILHVAPERQLNQKLRSLGAKITNIDARKSGYRFAYGMNTITADLTQLPFGSHSYDWIIANHVLEHIENEHDALTEVYRVLKPGGKAVFMVPYSPILENTIEANKKWTAKDRTIELGQRDHVRLYGKDIVQKWGQIFEEIHVREMSNSQNMKLNIHERIFVVEK